MQGLLGNSMDDPRTMAVLQGVMGLLGARGNVQGVAQGLLGYQGAMQQAKQQAAQEDERATRRQMAEMQLRQAQQEQARRVAVEQAYRGALRSPEQMAMAANGGPTNAAAQAAPGMAPGFDQNALIRGLTQADPMAAAQLLQPKPADYKVVGDALLQVGPGGVKEAYRAPAKPETPDEFTRRMIQAGIDPASPQGQQLARQALLKQTTHAPAPSATVINQGQKGFDNTLKLRGDFRSEPIYKAHQEMQSAYSQIKQALNLASPAGDLAGATKIMKLLDPGSVVRESELGMAMAATGALDRLTNYASMIINGTKLTPDQRKDFQTLADRLYSESGSQYNSKRAEYQGIAERNGLSVADVLGNEATKPKTAHVNQGQTLRWNPNTGSFD